MTLEPKPGGFLVRLRYGRDESGKPQRDRFLIATQDETVAGDVEIRMTAAAKSLADLRHPKAGEFLTEMGKVAGDEKAFRALERVIDKLVAETAALPPPGAAVSGPSTFRDVVELWTSGKLLERYPDSKVKPKTERGRKIDLSMLRVFFPVLGHRPMSEITGEEILEAKLRIPSGIDPNTRITYLMRLRSVFKYSIRPLRLISAMPEEVQELPARKKRGLFWFLYPEEDALLLGCTAIPLAFRILYGWLTRNGGRIGETLKLDYLHLDLDRGRCRLEAEWTKTGRARFWDLEPDVHAAMRIWYLLEGEPAPPRRVFHSPTRATMSASTLIKRFRKDLLLAGVDRRELHVTTKGSRRLRVHDLRASFCTMARRRGMPDAWIMDRSGHENPGELQNYARMVRHADEHQLAPWFSPLDRAIPEFRFAGMGQAWAKPVRTPGKQATSEFFPQSMSDSGTGANQGKTPQKTASVTPETPLPPTSGPAENKGVGQSGPGQAEVLPAATVAPADPVASALAEVEATLARAIDRATEAGEWATVRILASELEARRKSREAQRTAGVASLDAARRKKDEGGK